MDAVALFHERRADVAAFAALVFRRPGDGDGAAPDTAVTQPRGSRAATPAYRRPASANVPVSRVLQTVKAQAARLKRAARRKKRTVAAGEEAVSAAAGGGSTLQTSGDVAAEAAMGFSVQELRDRTYLWMGEPVTQRLSAADVARRAAAQAASLTPQQQAKLRRLHIKRAHQRLLSPAQWALWLRRRRRLWLRRRPVARRRHVARRLALQHGKPMPHCACRNTPSKVARKACTASNKAAAAVSRRVTQWLPSHARLVKHFHHRVVAVAVQPAVTHAPPGGPLTADSSASRSAPVRLRGTRACMVARVAVATAPSRKSHRFLQRWVAALVRCVRPPLWQLRSHRGDTEAHTHAAPPRQRYPDAAMLADLSHHCVYTVVLHRATHRDVQATVSAAMDALDLRPNAGCEGPAPAGVCFALSPAAGRQRVSDAVATVVHGHMRCAEAQGAAASTLSRHTRVVPVVLVATPCPGGSADAAVELLLFSEAPVHLSRRALTGLAVRLVSCWSPCSACPTRAAVFEYWRCDSLRDSTPSTLATAKAALQRLALVDRRLRHRFRYRSRERADHHGAQRDTAAQAATAPLCSVSAKLRRGPKSSTSAPRLSLVVFPSIAAPLLRDGTVSSAGPCAFAWRLALLLQRGHRPAPAATPQAAPATAGSAASKASDATRPAKRRVPVSSRRVHFQLARRFLGLLVTAPPSQPPPTRGGRTKPRGRGRCRLLGHEDRVALLHLLGRPAYPLDYGLSRPSPATEQRRCQRGRPTPRRSRVTSPRRKRTRSPAPVAATLPAPLPSYQHTLEYYGTTSNAACRVLVRAAHGDRRLPALHSSVGTVLLQVRWWPEPKPRAGTAKAAAREGRALTPPLPCLVRVGVVTSSAFFAQRFGCVVAPVWCCFPPPPGGHARDHVHGAAACSEETVVAEGQPVVDVLPPTTAPATWSAASLVAGAATGTALQVAQLPTYVLAPAETAADLLRRSAALQRDEPPRRRHCSRHQRAFDLRRGRAARELETVLYDPLLCTTVQLIPLCV